MSALYRSPQTADRPDAAARDLLRLVGQFRWRLGWEQALLWVLRAACGGLLVVTLVYVIAWARLVPLPPELAGVAVGGPVLVALAVALVRWPSLARAARHADRRLGLDERLGTAIELLRAGGGARLVRLQVHDALGAGQAARRRWPSAVAQARRELLLTLALGSLAAGGVLLLTLGADVPRPSLALPIGGAVAAPTPEAEQGIPAPPPLAQLERMTTAGAVFEGVRDPRVSSLDREAAGLRLADAEADLAQRAEQAAAQRQALDRLGQALGQVSAGQSAADQLAQGDYQGAAEALSDLGREADQLSPAAKRELSQALQQAAGEIGHTDPGLAEQAQRAARALAGNEYAAQQRALEDLGRAAERSGSSVPSPRELAAERQRLQQQRQALGLPPSDASEPGQENQPSGATGQPNQAQALQPGEATTNAPQPTGQAGAEQGLDADSPLVPGRPGGSGAGSGPTGERLTTPAAAEQPRLDAAGELVEVPGRLTTGPGNGLPSSEPADPDAPDTGSLAGAAQDTLRPQRPGLVAPEVNAVPNDRRQVVRDYFSGEVGR